VDSDDWIEPEMIEVMLNQAESTECDLCICGYSVEFPRGTSVRYDFNKLSGYELRPQDKAALFKNRSITKDVAGFGEAVNINTGCAKLYRRNFLLNNDIYFNTNLITSEDSLFNMYAIQLSSRTIFCEGVFYRYRMHDSQSTTRYQSNAFKSAKMFLKETRIFADLYYTEDIANDIYNSRAVSALLRSIFHTYIVKDAPFTHRQRIAGIKAVLVHETYKDAVRHAKLRYFMRKQQLPIFILRLRLIYTYYFGMRFFRWLRSKK